MRRRALAARASTPTPEGRPRARAVPRASHHAGEHRLGEEGARGVGVEQLVLEARLHALDHALLLEKVHLALCRVHVHVERRGRQAKGEVDEGVGAFGEVGGVTFLDGAAERGALDQALVDEQQKRQPLA